MHPTDSVYGWIVWAVVSVAAIVGTSLVLPNRWPPGIQRLVVGAVVLHLVGAVLRMSVMVTWYGRGDFLAYYEAGLALAARIRSFDFEAFLSLQGTSGTAFVQSVSGFVLVFLGPSIRAEFSVFSLAATFGLVLLAVSGARAFPGADSRRIFLLLLAWPSLVFWPSSIGKEALILLSVGLVVSGWWGDGRRLAWGRLAAGLILAMFIRPHIALMFGVALGIADWLAPFRRLTAGRMARGVVLGAAAVVVGIVSLNQMGVEADQQAVQAFVTERSGRTAQGGSAFTSTSGVLAVPMAFVNVLARPFIWEVHNPLAALSAGEVLFFWALMWRRREDVRFMARHWRENRMLLLLVPMACVLIFFYGALVSNMGILARQRVVVLPLMFLIAEAAPSFRQYRRRLDGRRRLIVRSVA